MYSTPPTKDLLKSKTMAVIAMMRGLPKDGYGTTADAVTGTISKTMELCMSNTTTG
jgi:hypothetical protein